MDLDHPDVSDAVFFPTFEPADGTWPVPFGGGDLACRRCDWHPGAGTVIYFHGNGETAALCEGFYEEDFRPLGVNFVFAEYRGYGASGGTPALGLMLDDGERILDALGEPDARVVAFGRSLGTLYAAELARRRPGLAGVVLESGIADLSDLILRRVGLDPSDPRAADLLADARTRFDQRAKLGGYHGPVLVLHAEHDGLLDADHGERLHAWAAGPDKELLVFRRGDHNSVYLLNRPEYLARLGAFLRRAGLTAGG